MPVLQVQCGMPTDVKCSPHCVASPDWRRAIPKTTCVHPDGRSSDGMKSLAGPSLSSTPNIAASPQRCARLGNASSLRRLLSEPPVFWTGALRPPRISTTPSETRRVHALATFQRTRTQPVTRPASLVNSTWAMRIAAAGLRLLGRFKGQGDLP